MKILSLKSKLSKIFYVKTQSSHEESIFSCIIPFESIYEFIQNHPKIPLNKIIGKKKANNIPINDDGKYLYKWFLTETKAKKGIVETFSIKEGNTIYCTITKK